MDWFLYGNGLRHERVTYNTGSSTDLCGKPQVIVIISNV